MNGTGVPYQRFRFYRRVAGRPDGRYRPSTVSGSEPVRNRTGTGMEPGWNRRGSIAACPPNTPDPRTGRAVRSGPLAVDGSRAIGPQLYGGRRRPRDPTAASNGQQRTAEMQFAGRTTCPTHRQT